LLPAPSAYLNLGSEGNEVVIEGAFIKIWQAKTGVASETTANRR